MGAVVMGGVDKTGGKCQFVRMWAIFGDRLVVVFVGASGMLCKHKKMWNERVARAGAF